MAFDLHRAVVLSCLALMMLAVPVHAKDFMAAVLKTGFPGEDAALLTALSDELKDAGYSVVDMDAIGLCDPAKLDAKALDLLVLPDASTLPAKAALSIQAYLKGGGDIMALNTPMWQRALINVEGKWLTRDEYQFANAGKLPEHVLFDFTPDDIVGWQRTSNTLEVPSTSETVADGPVPGQRALHVIIPNLTSWDNVAVQDVKDAFANGNTLTVFSAKGDSNTSQLLVEWDETDGSRWMAVVALTPEWRQYILTPDDFKYWQSNPARGGRGDRFKPENAEAMSVGLAHTHTTAIGSGRFEYWVGPFGTAKMIPEYAEVLQAIDPPALDTLSPGYKLFEMHDVTGLKVRNDQVIVDQEQLSLPKVLRSPHPRPKGGGYDKGREWRWIPLLEGRSANGDWRGTPATLMVNTSGQYKGGVWASFGIGDVDWYKTPSARKMIRQIAERMKNPVWMVDGGTNYFTYFEDQKITLGTQMAALSGNGVGKITTRVALNEAVSGKIAYSKEWGVTPNSRGASTVSATWKPGVWPQGGFIATAEIIQDGKVTDRVVHEVNVWKPKPAKSFMTVKNGDFYLDGKRWRAHGVNYMPSSGIGTEDGEYFEHYLCARAYDPEVYQRDLDHLKEIGLNAVSIFIYTGVEKDQNLLDLLRRLEVLGIKADVALRPGTPFDFEWPKIGQIITNSRLAENDTVFAYDLAWEPSFGHQRERTRWDGEWEKWIVERYGSVANAEADWDCKAPRDDAGKITNPLPAQVDISSPANGMVAAYRRFLDTLLYKKYGDARRLVRGVDPNHMVSFRMSEAANPTYHWEGRITYDFPYLAGAVDILAPEAYGRIGGWESVKPGWFQFEWGRLSAPQRPFMWKEMGCSTWDVSRMENSETRLAFQEDFYKNFYRMLISTGTDGVFFWWYPGGFRYGENSDYGIINPDGTDRPVTRVIRANAKQFLDGASTKPVDHWIAVDRDAHSDGISGIYDEVKDQFWETVDKGLTPGMRTTGTGTDSSNCPLVAVGNTECSGTNPPKYLDAAIDSVEILDASGKWVSVLKGGSVKVNADKPVMARIEITNLGEAKLLGPTKGDKAGEVFITVRNGAKEQRTSLPYDAARLHPIEVKDVVLAQAGIKKPTTVTIGFYANARVAFGEKFTITLQPR